jgi:hypothetical protein
MKKTLFLLTTLIFLGCQNQDSAGFANYDGRFDSYDADAKYVLGSDEDAQLAVNLVLAYADKDTDYMVGRTQPWCWAVWYCLISNDSGASLVWLTGAFSLQFTGNSGTILVTVIEKNKSKGH